MRHEGEISIMCNISASAQSCATLVPKIGEYGHCACKDIKPQRSSLATAIVLQASLTTAYLTLDCATTVGCPRRESQ